MADTVVDSSVVVKWILPEPDSGKAQQLLVDASGSGDRLIVLDLAFAEVANAIWKREHRKLLTPDEARRSLSALLAAPVQIEPSLRLLPAAYEIASKYDRSVYDALFVALARDLGVRGVTADEPLQSAVRADFGQIVLLRDL